MNSSSGETKNFVAIFSSGSTLSRVKSCCLPLIISIISPFAFKTNIDPSISISMAFFMSISSSFIHLVEDGKPLLLALNRKI